MLHSLLTDNDRIDPAADACTECSPLAHILNKIAVMAVARIMPDDDGPAIARHFRDAAATVLLSTTREQRRAIFDALESAEQRDSCLINMMSDVLGKLACARARRCYAAPVGGLNGGGS